MERTDETLSQFVAARGGRHAKAGRDLLELLAVMRKEEKVVTYMTAVEAAKILKDDPILIAWLEDAGLDENLEEVCNGKDCDGRCESCQDKARSAAEARYDSMKEGNVE